MWRHQPCSDPLIHSQSLGHFDEKNAVFWWPKLTEDTFLNFRTFEYIYWRDKNSEKISCHIHFIHCRVMIFSLPVASRFALVSHEMPCPPRLAYRATVMQVRAFEVAWDQAPHCGKKKKKSALAKKKKIGEWSEPRVTVQLALLA